MANGEYEIDEQTYKAMDSDTQLWMLFKTFNAHREACNNRICKLEKQKKVNTVVAGGGGVIGGIMAFFSSKLFTGG